MDLKPLPFRSTLQRYQKQAEDLLESHRSRDSQATRLFHENHPRYLDSKILWLPRNLADSEIQNTALDLGDARLALARWYSFQNWTALAEYVEEVIQDSPVFHFESAVEAVISGDLPAFAIVASGTSGPGSGAIDAGHAFRPSGASRHASSLRGRQWRGGLPPKDAKKRARNSDRLAPGRRRGRRAGELVWSSVHDHEPARLKLPPGECRRAGGTRRDPARFRRRHRRKRYEEVGGAADDGPCVWISGRRPNTREARRSRGPYRRGGRFGVPR